MSNRAGNGITRQERLRRIRRVQELTDAGLSRKAIAQRIGIAESTVTIYMRANLAEEMRKAGLETG